MDQGQTIARLLLRAGSVLFRPAEPFTFASGVRSPIYCDNRLLIGEPEARRIIAGAFAEHVGAATVVAGTATAGIPWAAWVAAHTDLPMAYVRGGAKGHGRGRQIEGADVAGRRVVLLEDTISSGESALQAAAALRAAGADVTGCVAIFAWGWPATAAAFVAAATPLHTLTSLEDVLAAAQADGQLTAGDAALVARWSRDPQHWP